MLLNTHGRDQVYYLVYIETIISILWGHRVEMQGCGKRFHARKICLARRTSAARTVPASPPPPLSFSCVARGRRSRIGVISLRRGRFLHCLNHRPERHEKRRDATVGARGQLGHHARERGQDVCGKLLLRRSGAGRRGGRVTSAPRLRSPCRARRRVRIGRPLVESPGVQARTPGPGGHGVGCSPERGRQRSPRVLPPKQKKGAPLCKQ
jgi:hypothetical protein